MIDPNYGIPADWWVQEDADERWLESQQQELQGEDEDDDREQQSFK